MHPTEFFVVIVTQILELWQVTAWYFVRLLVLLAALTLVIAADRYVGENRQ